MNWKGISRSYLDIHLEELRKTMEVLVQDIRLCLVEIRVAYAWNTSAFYWANLLVTEGLGH
jgi:hypothetical protein